MSALLKDVERVTRFSLTNHKLFLRHKPLLPTSLEGKALTLTDYAIRKEDTLLIQKESSDLNITNSQVCFLLGCEIHKLHSNNVNSSEKETHFLQL